MDGLDLELYQPLSYGDDEEEEASREKLKNGIGRKRISSPLDIESTKQSRKRQRVEIEEITDDFSSPPSPGVRIVEVKDTQSESPSYSPRTQTQTQQEEDDDSETEWVIDIDEDKLVLVPKSDSGQNQDADVFPSPTHATQNHVNGGSDRVRRELFTPTPPRSTRALEDVAVDAEVSNPRYRRVLKRIPQDIPYLPVTCEDGSRLYLRLKEKLVDNEKDSEETSQPSLASGVDQMNLYGDKQWDAIKRAARALKDGFHKQLEKAVNDEVFSSVLDDPSDKENVSESLWVEKYKPRSFLDLLSVEAVNRGLLHWLKLWDKSVFGRDYLAKVKANREKYAKLEAMEREKDEQFKRKTFNLLPEEEEYDDRFRPKIKIALLAGDPGLGKTTCAHIIAKHAGYRIVEINASDDRSTEVFRKALTDTEERTDLLITDGRPKCLVIDEIDGAPSASVKILVDYATGNIAEKGKKKKKCLLRPIICICNDLFATSLKELKKHAFIIQFPQIPVPRLAERLIEVSKNEKLHIDHNTLQALCQKSECDIRSCLSTLQFLKRGLCTAKQALDKVGAKDKAKGIFSVWTDIFTLPPEKRYQDPTADPSKPDQRFWNTLKSVQNHGEYDKVFSGVFEHYLRVKYKDIYLQSVMEGLEWATWFETIQDFTQRTQDYSMFGFLPCYFVAAHFLFARKDIPVLGFPYNEFVTRINRLQTTVKSQISESHPAIARFLDPYMLITDIYPAILSIIQPCNIRPVPTQIWTQRERDTLKNVVEVMLTYNLTYAQVKHPENGTYSFLLEPDLESMVRFKGEDGSNPSGRKPFPYAIKQLVAREVETEKMRRNDSTPEIIQKDTFKKPQTPGPAKGISPSIPTTPKSKTPEALTKKSPTIIGRDFFGRPIVPTEETSPEAESKRKKAVAVYFRYKEGYSNAVRRYVKMKDL